MQVDLLHALDLAGLDETAELGHGLPLLLVALGTAASAATATASTATSVPAATVSARAESTSATAGSCVCHGRCCHVYMAMCERVSVGSKVVGVQ